MHPVSLAVDLHPVVCSERPKTVGRERGPWREGSRFWAGLCGDLLLQQPAAWLHAFQCVQHMAGSSRWWWWRWHQNGLSKLRKNFGLVIANAACAVYRPHEKMGILICDCMKELSGCIRGKLSGSIALRSRLLTDFCEACICTDAVLNSRCTHCDISALFAFGHLIYSETRSS